MRAIRLTIPAITMLVTAQLFGQSGAVIPQPAGSAGHAERASCVILKRMGPADQVTSHLYSFGIRGKQFQYVEGKLPDGFPFHGRLTDHDVRNLQARNAEVIVLNQNYTPDELKQARSDCEGQTGKTPNQADEKATDPPEQKPAVAHEFAAAAAAPAATPAAKQGMEVEVTSVPSGADIEVDGSFVGSTPSTVTLTPGQHKIEVKKNGFIDWQRTISVSSGHITVNAELEKMVFRVP